MKHLVLIGLGGLGTPFLQSLLESPLAPLKVSAFDHDSVALSNLNRQTLFTPEDIGSPKAKVVGNRLKEFGYGAEGIDFSASPLKISKDNISSHLSGADLVFEGSDSPQTKLLVNDFCSAENIPSLIAGFSGVEGFCLLSPRDHHRTTPSPCLRCIFGEFSTEDFDGLLAGCHQAGVLGADCATVGFKSASLAKKILNGSIASPKLYKFNFADGVRMQELNVKPDKSCSMCCQHPSLKRLELRGHECPATFLYTKLALEQLESEAPLDARYSSLRSAIQVENTCAQAGHEIVSVTKELASKHFRLVIKPKGQV